MEMKQKYKNIPAKFFIPKPTATEMRGTGDYAHCTIYHVNGSRLYWSADFPLPEIADRIVITMNAIGPAEVVGYFSENGYLGVMTKALNPPEWLRRQRKEEAGRTDMPQWWRDGIGCEFGAEIALPTPEVEAKIEAENEAEAAQ